jgi:hypothetical protein
MRTTTKTETKTDPYAEFTLPAAVVDTVRSEEALLEEVGALHLRLGHAGRLQENGLDQE